LGCRTSSPSRSQPNHSDATPSSKATVARFPYYDGDLRNETFDVMKVVPERPYL
jgi:hypothetical protein